MTKVNIDGRVYERENLSEAAQANLAAIAKCDQRMNDLKLDLSLLQTARNAYAEALKAELPKDN